MPTGLVRLHDTGNLHFVPFSCYHRLPYLQSREARDLVEDAIERAHITYDFWITGYVVMHTHVHILISEPERKTIADVMKAIKLSVALRQIQRPFWEQRYYDFNVFTEEKRIEKLRYMHRNRSDVIPFRDRKIGPGRASIITPPEGQGVSKWNRRGLP